MPVRALEGSTRAEWIDFGVDEYLSNAKRYRTGLRRIDSDQERQSR